jgi:hypothetical protein
MAGRRVERRGVIPGGQPIYGADIGIIMLDSDLPRPIGDIGNARTFSFPVLYDVASGATPDLVVDHEATGLLQHFVEAGERLMARGARALTTSCGFLAIYQRELAAALPVPVATSALLQIPLVLRMRGPQERIGVITANATRLTERHLSGVGVDAQARDRLRLIGLEATEHFYPTLVHRANADLDLARAEEEVVTAALEALDEDPSLRAFVLECTNLPPYADAVRAATGLPVWDVITLIESLQRAVGHV